MYPLFLILVVFLSGAYAQFQLSGACNFTNIDYVRGVNATFMGNWNQLERISNTLEQGACSRSQYILTNPTISVINTEVVNQALRFRNGSMIQRNDGLLNITFPDGSYEYAVLRTDYTTYALLYSCRNEANNMKSVWGWKLSRSTTFTTQQTQEINEAVNGNADLRNATWSQVAHTTAACRTSSGTTLSVPPLVLFYTLLVIVKGYCYVN